jgi:starch-binding outer membrane protein, SusD/RagB family
MKIMNTRILLLSGFLFLIAVSCQNFLEPYPRGYYTDEDIWFYPGNVEGLINRCYDLMPDNYDNIEGAVLDGATDNAVITSTLNPIQRLATGSLITGQDPFRAMWNRNYQGIYLVNLFLEDRKGYNTRFLVEPDLDLLVRKRLQGEAFALRAWFQWDLLKKFGGKGIDGQLLGIPLITEPLNMAEDINLARSTYEESVKQILTDIDSAKHYIRIAHRDFLVPDSRERLFAGGKYWGRLDGITLTAIKADLYLTWASPRFNPGNITARWDSAAVNAKKVIDFKLTVDAVGFNPVNPVNFANPNFPGIIFSSRYSQNDFMERMFYPGGFLGNGEFGPSQNLVDAFPMANGYPITHPESGYDPQNPYYGRDPRFYSMIFYNDSEARRNNTGAVMYKFENWIGGRDEAGRIAQNSKTNYHVKKFVSMNVNWQDGTLSTQPNSKFFYRWAHMILAFAEAANHVVGPDDDAKYGMSARTAIQYLRSRRTYDGLNGISPVPPNPPDEYLAGVTSTAGFDELVKNERRIETCFEGMRFFDLRRWTTDLVTLNLPVKGARITRNGDGTFTYDLDHICEERRYISPYLPIPYSEILKMSNLVQNEGWSGWN